MRRVWPLLLLQLAAARYQCKGIDGRNVGWFVAYKMPTGVGGDGKHFLYADSKNQEWTLSKKMINDEASAIGQTISQIYKREPTAFSLMYSDDSPNAKSEGYRGHVKGLMLFDGSTGFWLSHSVPNFPPTSAYSYPASGVKFAQSFMCLSVPTDYLGDIGEQLKMMQATPFFNNLPEKFAKRFPVLRGVIAKQSLAKSATVFHSTKILRTVDGVQFRHFAKHKKYEKDVWLDLVASETGTIMAVQSWLNGGADDLHSTCRRDATVYDITTVNIMNYTFSSSKDHSKWGVSDRVSTPLVCVGDLNRQKSQLSRGGGALCVEHPRLWKTYNLGVNKFEACAPNGIHTVLYDWLVLIGGLMYPRLL